MKKVKEKLGIFGFFRRRKKLTVIIIIVIFGVLIWRSVVNKQNADTDSVEIQRGEVVEELILSGEIKADEHAQLRFGYSGKISWVGVSTGDEVKKGQSLSSLNTTNLSQDLKIADANLRQKASTLDRVYDDLKDKENDESYDEIETRTAAETNKDVTVYSHIKAQYNLGQATIRAPFDGIVSYIANPFSGANVLFSEPQIEIVNPDTVYFEVTADQSEVIDLHEGQKVKVVLDSFPDEEFQGMIDYIGVTPRAGEIGTVYEIKVLFVGSEFDLTKVRIGMTGDSGFILDEAKDALYVPPKYINSDTSGKYIRLGKKNNKVYVELGLEGEERTEIITEEVNEGDKIFD